MRAIAMLLMAVLAGCVSPAARKAPEDAVAKVDLERYMGTWHVIALSPSGGERDQVATSVEYSRRGGNIVNIDYWSRDHDFLHPLERRSGTATVQDLDSGALWSVEFPWSSADDYEILYLDPEYRYALVGDPGHRRALVLAREQRITDEVYEVLLAVLKVKKYDVNQLLRVPQVEDQLGAPGYSP